MARQRRCSWKRLGLPRASWSKGARQGGGGGDSRWCRCARQRRICLSGHTRGSDANVRSDPCACNRGRLLLAPLAPRRKDGLPKWPHQPPPPAARQRSTPRLSIWARSLLLRSHGGKRASTSADRLWHDMLIWSAPACNAWVTDRPSLSARLCGHDDRMGARTEPSPHPDQA